MLEVSLIPGDRLPVRVAQLTRPSRRTQFILALAATLLAGTGCGGSDGVQRSQLSGKVTFAGKPIPNGYLLFRPDKKAGNSGPGSTATIVDGKYETMDVQGTVGGPHVVRITGTDGIPYKMADGTLIPIGKPLFPEYETRADLPKESGGTVDFDVPAEQAEKK